MIKKIRNLSSRPIVEELEIAIFEGTLEEANSICDEYNLRIIEIEMDEENNTKIYTIGDNDYGKKAIETISKPIPYFGGDW